MVKPLAWLSARKAAVGHLPWPMRTQLLGTLSEQKDIRDIHDLWWCEKERKKESTDMCVSDEIFLHAKAD